jgi:hypothetical protein
MIYQLKYAAFFISYPLIINFIFNCETSVINKSIVNRFIDASKLLKINHICKHLEHYFSTKDEII